MPKRNRNTPTARAGVNYLRTLVESENCIFHEIPQQDDVGNDALLQFVRDDGTATGIYVFCQIKSGESFVSKSQCAFSSDKDHFEYWADHTFPVVAVVYDPGESKAYWHNISDWLRNDTSVVQKGPFTVRFAKGRHSLLDETTFRRSFYAHFSQNRPASLDDAVAMLHSADRGEHEVGAIILARAFGRSRAAWDALFYELHFGRHVPYSGPLLYAVAGVVGHPDVLWTPGMVIHNRSLRQQLLSRIEELPYSVVERLLLSIDEYGIDRATIGQQVEAILSANTRRKEMLIRALDRLSDHWATFNCACLLAYYDGTDSLNHIRPLVPLHPELQQLVDVLEGGGEFLLY